MTLIASGRGLLKRANVGQANVAKAEAQEEVLRVQRQMAEEAAESQVLGTAGGIGGMVGANRAFANADKAAEAIDAANKLVGNGSQIGSSGGGLTFAETGGSVLEGAKATTAINDLAVAADLATAGEAAATTAATGAELTTAAAGAELTTAAAGGEAVAATQAASVAAGNTGAMATLGTVAAPIAIALGIGFLFNELF